MSNPTADSGVRRRHQELKPRNLDNGLVLAAFEEASLGHDEVAGTAWSLSLADLRPGFSPQDLGFPSYFEMALAHPCVSVHGQDHAFTLKRAS